MGDKQGGEVVHLHSRTGYRPDLGALARNHISTARQRLGLDAADFAARLAPLLGWIPTPEVVESWETHATPPGDVVLAVGMAVQEPGSAVLTFPLSSDAERRLDLLASTISDLERAAVSPDIVRAYAKRGMVTRPEWNDMVRGSRHHLWLYGMAELGYALDDEVPEVIANATRDGCDIRVLLLDPEYPGITDIDEDEANPPGTLKTRIRAGLNRFHQINDACGNSVQIRIYNSPPTVSIVRGDDRILVTPYLRFFVGGNSPTLELKRTPGGNMFDRYTRHFENMWNTASE